MSIKIGNNNNINNSNIIENSKINQKDNSKNGFWRNVFENITSSIIWEIIKILFSGGVLFYIIYKFIIN